MIPGSILPAPAQCFSCGSIGIDMLDTGMNEAYYGAILICINCFREAATRIPELELVSRKYYDESVAMLVSQMGLVNKIEPAIKQLYTDLGSAIHSIRDSLSIPSDDNDTSDDDGVAEVPDTDNYQKYL